MEYDDRVMCSLIDEKIDPMECVDVVDCVLNPFLRPFLLSANS